MWPASACDDTHGQKGINLWARMLAKGLLYTVKRQTFFQLMCGGMSVMDGLLVLFWLALQVTWVVASVQRKLPNLRGTARCLSMG